MTSGKVEQSRRKLQKLLWDGEQRSKRRALISWGITLEYSLVYDNNLSLVRLRALQVLSMWGTFSNISEQASESWHVPRLLADQWLHRASVLYLPDAMTACMLANSLPIIDHLFLDILLERYFAGRILEKVDRVGKVIKETKLTYLVKPGLGGQYSRGKDSTSMDV